MIDTLTVVTSNGVEMQFGWPLMWLLIAVFVPGTMVAGRWVRAMSTRLWEYVVTLDDHRRTAEAERNL